MSERGFELNRDGLGILLFTIGAFFLLLGPLIALILYWNLLDRMRKHLIAIEKTGEPAQLPHMAAA